MSSSVLYSQLRRTVAVLLALPLFAAAVLGVMAEPNSIKLIYFPKKNFRVGDWVLYRIRAVNEQKETAIDYQRVQIASQLTYRGEPCFWLETGFGPSPDTLSYTAIMVSETIFQDSLAEARADVHMRRMIMMTTPEGVPVSGEARSPARVSRTGELRDLIPKRSLIGTDTLRVRERTYFCQVFAESLLHAQIDEQPDSSIRYLTVKIRRRWIDPSVPITGLVKEVEHKELYRQAWPLGKLRADFPEVLTESYDYEVQLANLGTGAKPAISDRVVNFGDPRISRGATP